MLEWIGQWEENLVYFCPYTGEYGSMKDRILAYFMQWVSLTYDIVKAWKEVVIQILMVDIFFIEVDIFFIPLML